jgi:hypothetical protein
MAQKTAWTGATLTESDINTYLMHEGGAWTSWTPTVTQSGSVTVTNTRSRYARWGRLIVFNGVLAVTGSGTGSNIVTVSLPVTAAVGYGMAGNGYIYDVSATGYYSGNIEMQSTTTFGLLSTATDGNSSPFLGNVGFTAALASGDGIRFAGMYEAAS